MPPPLARISRSTALHIKSGDCGLCVLGDSTVTDSSSDTNLPYGIQRNWLPDTWSARFGRAEAGPPAWALVFGIDTFTYSGGANGRVPGGGVNYTGGIAPTLSPNNGTDITFTGNPSAFNTVIQVDANGLADYGAGNPFSGLACKTRLVYWRAAGQAALRGVALRGGSQLDWPGTAFDMAGASGIQYVDFDNGSGAGAPGVLIVGDAADETGKEFFPLACGFYRHSGGTRVPGFSLSQHGEGGWNTDDHSGTTRCTNANLEAFIAATFANTFLIYIGTNVTVGQGTELAAGVTTAFKAAVEAIVARYQARAIAAGVASPRFILANPHAVSALTSTQLSTRGQAIYEAAVDGGWDFIDVYQGVDMTGLTTDGVHLNTDGADAIAEFMWEQIEAAAADVPGSGGRPACQIGLGLGL
jgi:lysophospholipase L1-like esterase